jgi:hypothetical protein
MMVTKELLISANELDEITFRCLQEQCGSSITLRADREINAESETSIKLCPVCRTPFKPDLIEAYRMFSALVRLARKGSLQFRLRLRDTTEQKGRT